MHRKHRCLVTDVNDHPAQLSKETVHHLGRVLRLPPGEEIEVVDGRGGLGEAEWSGSDRIEIVRQKDRAKPPVSPLILAVSPPRLPRLDWLVEKASELGVSKIVPLITQHSPRKISAARLERLQRKADQAMLQCRRLYSLEVSPPTTWGKLLEQIEGVAWLAVPPDSPAKGPLPPQSSAGPLTILIGPEGGFSEQEESLALNRGVFPVSLGQNILRVETAALALVAAAVWSREDGSLT